MSRMYLRQAHEVADVERQDAAAVRGSLQQLLLIAGIQLHPLTRRAGHVVTTFQ